VPDSRAPDSRAQVEAGPPRRHYPFCPTIIDVYGGTNFVFPLSGGPQSPPADLSKGLVGSENQGYDQTLAGRLATRLQDDSEVTPLLGSTWTIRSCAGLGEGLAQLVPPLEADNCGRNSPPNNKYVSMCSESPAPVMLIAASMLDDGCHGGGPDSDLPDDAATYQDHYRQRLNSFLGSRKPAFALVGPRTEWTNGASSTFGVPSCRWARPDWEREALLAWKDEPPPGIEADYAGELNEQFKRHHRCCRDLNLSPCDSTWFDRWDANYVNPDGAQQIVNLWYGALKRWLLANDFDCP
jgi:hypothetical protein